MYFPYLRGKQFEIEALLALPAGIFSNTFPIIEPVNTSQRRLYRRVAEQNIPVILIMNPFHPADERLSMTTVQGFVDTEMVTHTTLTLGYIIDPRIEITELRTFLNSNRDKNKVLIFRFNPLAADLTRIQTLIATHPVQHIIFDDRKTSSTTRAAFNTHPSRILLIDGFQRQDRNADYPAVSSFDSIYQTWGSDGWAGTGDYLTVGDFFQAGGGQVYVVSLHVTRRTNNGLIVHHFSSTVHATTKGFAAIKFAEANNELVSSRFITPLRSDGLDLFRDWHARSHNPQLGAAKKASIMHHIALLSSIV